MMKRILDIIVAGLLLLASSPILLVALLGVGWKDGFPVIVKQTRVGLDGEPFQMFKIRTMYRDAAAILERHLATDYISRCEWNTYLRLRNDPRILGRFGRLLRELSIDELPQLWNVLRGEMSLVGPRPFTLDHIHKLSPRARSERNIVRPGMTGLWQVCGRGSTMLTTLQRLDRLYLRHRSLTFDCWILLRTVPNVLLRKGAY